MGPRGCKVTPGRWKMAQRGWKMGRVGWKIGFGGWKMTLGGCRIDLLVGNLHFLWVCWGSGAGNPQFLNSF